MRRILSAFATDPSLGLVTSPGNLLDQAFWGGDRYLVDGLLRRLELEVEDDQLHFPAGSIYWARAFVVQGLSSLALTEADFEDESGQVDATAAHAVERIIGILTEESGYSMVETAGLRDDDSDQSNFFESGAPRAPRARVLPFYLPQFHRFAENDEWWGTGFTEWTNVARSRPVFHGQRQPLLPAELGFYDLETSPIRDRQYELAREAGIEGFMYYYYWFAGRSLMTIPIERLAAEGGDHPFCIMWANENWTRRWDGSTQHVLIGQDYDRVPAAKFIEDVAHLLRDPRYLRVDGKPILSVYRISQLPDFELVIAEWRAYARANGIGELYLLTVDVGESMQGIGDRSREAGLDGTMQFPPHNLLWEPQDVRPLHLDDRFTGLVLRYDSMARDAEFRLRGESSREFHPAVMVGFDNTARRQWQSDIWYGSNPYSFRRWLGAAISAVSARPADERIVFVNAWNEWAESAVLEPTARFGNGYLLAVRDALMG